MQVCTSLQTDNHASTSPLSFLQAGCLSCRPTNSVKALKANQSTEGMDENTEIKMQVVTNGNQSRLQWSTHHGCLLQVDQL